MSRRESFFFVTVKTVHRIIKVIFTYMKKLLSTLLLVGLLIPTVAEAGFSPEGRRRPRCRTQGKVIVCRMPRVRRPKRCGIMPCIPDGYYRPNPRRRAPLYPMPNG